MSPGFVDREKPPKNWSADEQCRLVLPLLFVRHCGFCKRIVAGASLTCDGAHAGSRFRRELSRPGAGSASLVKPCTRPWSPIAEPVRVGVVRPRGPVRSLRALRVGRPLHRRGPVAERGTRERTGAARRPPTDDLVDGRDYAPAVRLTQSVEYGGSQASAPNGRAARGGGWPGAWGGRDVVHGQQPGRLPARWQRHRICDRAGLHAGDGARTALVTILNYTASFATGPAAVCGEGVASHGHVLRDGSRPPRPRWGP